MGRRRSDESIITRLFKNQKFHFFSAGAVALLGLYGTCEEGLANSMCVWTPSKGKQATPVRSLRVCGCLLSKTPYFFSFLSLCFVSFIHPALASAPSPGARYPQYLPLLASFHPMKTQQPAPHAIPRPPRASHPHQPNPTQPSPIPITAGAPPAAAARPQRPWT